MIMVLIIVWAKEIENGLPSRPSATGVIHNLTDNAVGWGRGVRENGGEEFARDIAMSEATKQSPCTLKEIVMPSTSGGSQ